jgi:hypothetical protein
MFKSIRCEYGQASKKGMRSSVKRQRNARAGKQPLSQDITTIFEKNTQGNREQWKRCKEVTYYYYFPGI